MSDYLHGIETRQINEINMTIKPADMSAVCVIGTSPVMFEGCPKIANYSELNLYLGKNIDGFTLAEAAETILKESEGADIYPINIYDRTKHYLSESKAAVFTSGSCTLTELDVFDLTLTKDENTLVLDTDYTFSDNVITVKAGGAIENNQEGVTVSYKYFDASKITDSDVIGEVSAGGERSGLQKIYDIIALNGTAPGIIIAPGFASKNVRNALTAIAEDLRALVFLDAPQGVKLAAAENARLAETGGIDLTGTSENAVIAMPWVKRYNSNQNTETLKPLSPVSAGIRVRLDRERNIAKSIDNTVSKTITGLEYPVYFSLNDASCDANRFNAKGITAVINYKGEYRLWGGRNMSFPNNSGLMTFESAKRTRNFINISIENSSFECIGENITQGFIDDVLNSINSAFRAWSNPLDRKNQIIYSGEAYYDENKNTAQSLADGHITFSYRACPLASAERITFEDVLDITIIAKTLGG